MAPSSSISSLLLLLFLSYFAASSTASSNLRTYIVQAPAHAIPPSFASKRDWHEACVRSVTSDNNPEQRVLYSYDVALEGFSAKLTETEAAKLQGNEAITMVMEDGVATLHTTRTRNFMEMTASAGIWPVAEFGRGVIVGLVDTGVWPERQSFDDKGMPAVPSRWKGGCEEAPPSFRSSLCNRKLIGALSFYKGYEANHGPINETLEYKSPRDSEGHGTHTSSTATGAHVRNASVLGYAPGSALGMAPLAHVAIYKACWLKGCFNSDIFAAMDQAIADGVDVLSLSIGGNFTEFDKDPIAVGSFAATKKGIIVSLSAGNNGPTLQTVTNVPPWVLTVAASSIDRAFPAPVTLGNGKTYIGASLYSGKGLPTSPLPLVYGGALVWSGNVTAAELCEEGALDPKKVAGKIVFCERGDTARAEKGFVVQKLGAAGMILGNNEGSGEELAADSHILPATIVGFSEANAIKNYINSTNSATATIIFEGTKVKVNPAPVMAAFSSRGPNPSTFEILKPDITAPGVNILAAWTDAVGPSSLPEDHRKVEFNIISGTSMSCPHVGGVIALLRSAHPDWSPAAIRSAVMTSANIMDNAGGVLTDGAYSGAADPYAYGSGHINPNAAVDPGLIYDSDSKDYLDFLCSLNYLPKALKVFNNGVPYECSDNNKIRIPRDLNYPSIAVEYRQSNSSSFSAEVTRTVTNVGPPASTYHVYLSPPQNVAISVEPSTLAFNATYQKLSYTLSFSAKEAVGRHIPFTNFGYLSWMDGLHVVRSPIAFTWTF